MLIHTWRPWEKSTGPVTTEGKAIVARNADKGKAEQRRLARHYLARAKYCLKQYDLLLREIAMGPSTNKRLIPD
jgi:hypothetical protein